MNYGLDCGTGNFLAADKNGIRLQRNAFLTLGKEGVNKKQLKLMNVPFIEINNEFHIIGTKAYEYAQIFNSSVLRRPMAQGVLNPNERDAFPILRLIIKDLLGNFEENSKVVYCVPGTPIDKIQEVDYHKDVLKTIIESLGCKATSINEATALAYYGLASDELTGIAISLGSGMANITIMYQGMSALTFSTTKAGDWIDDNVARDTGISKAKAQYIKEAGGFSIAPNSTSIYSPEQQAIKSYYSSLFSYLLKNIAAQFKSTSMPNFPKPVPIVLGGGSSKADGVIELFKTQFESLGLPIEISDIKLVTGDPITAVVQGCLIEADLSEE